MWEVTYALSIASFAVSVHSQETVCHKASDELATQMRQQCCSAPLKAKADCGMTCLPGVACHWHRAMIQSADSVVLTAAVMHDIQKGAKVRVHTCVSTDLGDDRASATNKAPHSVSGNAQGT